MDIAEILKRKEPVVCLVSPEEGRIEREIQRYCDSADPTVPIFRWTSTRGMERIEGVVEPVKIPDHPDQRIQMHAPLVAALRWAVHECEQDGIFLFKDVHHFLRSGGGNYNAAMAYTTRGLRDAFYELRELKKSRKIVLLMPELIVPTDLEKEVRIYDLPLPSRDDLLTTVNTALKRASAIHKKDRTFEYQVKDPIQLGRSLANAALGLTVSEFEYILDNLLYVDRQMTEGASRTIVREKQQIIRKSGVLEFIAAEDLQDLEIGGLDALLRWLKLRKHVFENQDIAERDYGIKEVPRGVLLVGITGCGKSLVCKQIASEWGYPLLRLDVGAIFDRWVGASEERMRTALKIAESIAPCVLWIDEIEKGFNVGSGGDGGTSSRVLGTFLVWMQEKKAPVFIAATANDISALPPELLRPGRFDNRFFVGCPGEVARREIFEIHLRARMLAPHKFDLDGLVDLTFGYTGAEIEQIVLDSAYDAFFESRRATTEDIVRNIQRSRPLVKSLGRQMERILKMLDDGRIELASDDTVLMKDLIATLHIDMS